MRGAGSDERGLSLAGLLVSLLVLAVMAGGSLAALSLGGSGTKATLGLPSSGTGAAAQPSAGGLVAEAADIAAQQNLDTALSVVDQAALSGGYGHLTPGALEGAARQLTFTSGASSGDDDASLATSSAPGSGSVTLALRSSSGTCFFVWTSTASTWYGAEPDAPSCAATPLSEPAASSIPGPGRAGWQQGSFPAASG